MDMTDEEIVEAMVRPLSLGTERGLGRKPTEAEFRQLCSWVARMRVRATLIQGCIDGDFVVCWSQEKDDWIFNVKRETDRVAP
jgi:hypothetical protein